MHGCAGLAGCSATQVGYKELAAIQRRKDRAAEAFERRRAEELHASELAQVHLLARIRAQSCPRQPSAIWRTTHGVVIAKYVQAVFNSEKKACELQQALLG